MKTPPDRTAVFSACVVACLLLAGCSDGPSTSEIKEAFQRQGAGAPDDMDCSLDRNATAALRQQFPGQKRWVMNCTWHANGGTGSEQVPLLRGDDGQLRISVR